MGAKTSIQWTDSTWNPIRARHRKDVGWHCEKVSPGCQNCYAERLNRRLGTKFEFRPLHRVSGDVELFLDDKILTEPLRWRKQRRVFVCSMTDLFGGFHSDHQIDRVFAVMLLSPQHQFQVLTKRAERMRKYMSEPGRLTEIMQAASREGFDEWTKETRSCRLPTRAHVRNETSDELEIAVDCPGWPLPNVWLGISAEDQQRLDERVPELLATSAAVRFVSAEPLLGPLDLFKFLSFSDDLSDRSRRQARLWVICGGESGSGARPMDVAWALDIVRQCREAGVACFTKQLGAHPVIQAANGSGPEVLRRQQSIDREWPLGTHFGNSTTDPSLNGRVVLLHDRKGGAPEEWPEDLRVREFPGGTI